MWRVISASPLIESLVRDRATFSSLQSAQDTLRHIAKDVTCTDITWVLQHVNFNVELRQWSDGDPGYVIINKEQRLISKLDFMYIKDEELNN